MPHQVYYELITPERERPIGTYTSLPSGQALRKLWNDATWDVSNICAWDPDPEINELMLTEERNGILRWEGRGPKP